MRNNQESKDRFSQYLAERVHKTPKSGSTNDKNVSNTQNQNNSLQLSLSRPHSSSIEYSISHIRSSPSLLPKQIQKNNQNLSLPSIKSYKKRRLRKLCDLQHCPICLQVIRGKSQMSCGHSFCKQCLVQWLNLASTCPYCRKDCTHYVYCSQHVLIEQKKYEEEENQFIEEYILNYQCYLCEQTKQGDTVVICDRCQFHASHIRCDSRIIGPLNEDQDWYCHFCS